MGAKPETRIFAVARRQCRFRMADVVTAGISPDEVHRLVRVGRLQEIGHGWYALPRLDPSDPRTLAEVTKHFPKGLFCVLTALRFHGMSGSQASDVWLGMDRRLGVPKIDIAPVRIVRMSGAALTAGVEEYEIDRVRVRITNPARTVVDCFKFRNKIGREVALDALKQFRQLRKGSSDEIWAHAEALRMSNVIRPHWALLL